MRVDKNCIIHPLTAIYIQYICSWEVSGWSIKRCVGEKPNCWTKQMLVDVSVCTHATQRHTWVPTQRRGRCGAAEHSPGSYIRDPLGLITVAGGSSCFPVSAKHWSSEFVATVTSELMRTLPFSNLVTSVLPIQTTHEDGGVFIQVTGSSGNFTITISLPT